MDFSSSSSDPEQALSDASTMVPLHEVKELLYQAKPIHDTVRGWERI
jgi:3-deoxy-D-manno-octulosonic acid (KDO) 8-phosphate synthase